MLRDLKIKLCSLQSSFENVMTENLSTGRPFTDEVLVKMQFQEYGTG